MINHPHRSKKRAAASGIASPSPRPAPRRVAPARGHVDHGYAGFLEAVRARFAQAIAGDFPIFQTNATDANSKLFDIYIASLPSQRQHHTCSTCRRFIETYGGLVKVDETNGALIPLMWGPIGPPFGTIPDFYRGAVVNLHEFVKSSTLTGVFLTSQKEWGTPVTPGTRWTHLAVTPPRERVHADRLLTAGQAAAVVRENVKTVRSALAEYPADLLDRALAALRAEQMERSEKFLAPVQWLRDLHARHGKYGPRGENLLWLRVASAPEGFCHVKSSVVGPLLDDLRSGLPWDTIRARHAAKLDPLRYQRPQAPPAAGNVAAAEKVFEKLGLAPSLERRFATLDDVGTEAIWLPRPPAGQPRPSSGVFAHVATKGASEPTPTSGLPTTTVTWEKFARTVLPTAERIELLVPQHGRFIALTTAVHPDAPPILKWDWADRRNPLAWYVYPKGSPCGQWKLHQGWWKVTAVAPFPTMMGDQPMPFLAEGVVLALEGAVDTRDDAGNGLFPECLIEEVHGCRSTIEAYSRGAKLGGRDEASACGYDVRRGAADCSLRVLASGAWVGYKVDRWD